MSSQSWLNGFWLRLHFCLPNKFWPCYANFRVSKLVWPPSGHWVFVLHLLYQIGLKLRSSCSSCTLLNLLILSSFLLSTFKFSSSEPGSSDISSSKLDSDWCLGNYPKIPPLRSVFSKISFFVDSLNQSFDVLLLSAAQTVIWPKCCLRFFN